MPPKRRVVELSTWVNFWNSSGAFSAGMPMGAAMMLQALGLSFHAAYFNADKAEIDQYTLYFYVMGKNISSAAMLLVLIIGTLFTWRARNRALGGKADPAIGEQAPA